MSRVAFIGRRGLGGVAMRGVAVANALGVPFLDLSELREGDHYDTLVLVKYWRDKADLIRRCCDRLVFDPLDCWESTKPNAEPNDFWPWTWRQIKYDDIISTSPSCRESMQNAFHADDLHRKTGAIGVHLAPHHADPRIGPNWYNPNGPVVYAGGLRFIESALPQIDTACKRLGRRLLLDYNRDCWRRLEGAALALHLRLPPTDTPCNRWCKPQVKLENAAAAGVQCLATPDPCVTSLHKTNVLYQVDLPWETPISLALDRQPLVNPVTLADHARRMAEILGLQK